jgi:alcohol dehydrogenase class IV
VTPEFKHATPAFRTYCGSGALGALQSEFDRLGVSKVALFCGPSMLRHRTALARLEEGIGQRLAGRFDAVREHSPIPVVEDARRFLQETGADAVVSLGGGSAVVTARAATILLAEGKDVRELCTSRAADGRLTSPRLSAPKMPNWIVPTTPTTAYAKAGSAVRDPNSGERLALFDPKTRAQGIFLDPQMALTAPDSLVRSSSLNAFAMAVEGLQAETDDPLADALLLHALRIIAEWLPRLDRGDVDGEVRMRLMLASLLAGQGTDHVGAGLAQALSHATGPRSSTSNGVVEALLLPHTMRFNAAVTENRLPAVAQALGSTPTGNGSLAESATQSVEQFLLSCSTPTRLRDVGVLRQAFPEIIDNTLEDWAITKVPRPVSRDDLGALLEMAW